MLARHAPLANVNNRSDSVVTAFVERVEQVSPVPFIATMGDSPPLSPIKGPSVSSLNTQLLAHGFAKRPLRLDALSDAEQVNVTGVIVELLGANVVSPSLVSSYTSLPSLSLLSQHSLSLYLFSPSRLLS